MTTWKDGGDYGRFHREVVIDDSKYAICHVRTKQYVFTSDGEIHKWDEASWPEGEANFALILQAPRILAALNMIAEGAIVSPDQSPEGIAKSVLRVLQLVREENCEYLLLISAQRKRAERAEEALEAIVKLDPAYWCQTELGNAVCDQCKAIARAAIAAVKGEGDGLGSRIE